MSELLLEILSEEIPARMQGRAAEDMKRLVCDSLTAAGLEFGDARAFVTPRRLALVVDGLPVRQPDTREERKGPAVGAPDRAVQGFLGSVGLTLEECEQRDVKGKPFWFAVIERTGRPTAELLAELLPDALHKLPWPKSMRWGSGDARWVRPVQGVLCVFDGKGVVFDLAGVTAGTVTRGHRFLAPDSFPADDFDGYRASLREAWVMLDPAERRSVILDQAREIAAGAGLRLRDDPGLLAEVAGLVEWPVPLMGRIDSEFMDVPPEVLTESMRAHQKYFALETAAGELAPAFITVANMVTEDGGTRVVAGNERVLRARLSDARFFWDTDRKASLESRVGKLGEIVFHARLGTVGDKVDRIEGLAAELCGFIPGADRNAATRAAHLAKADLVTGMVGEFPELQGVMGRYYAIHDGEDPEVAEAIADHYRPAGPADACPTAPAGIAVALADKIDSLVGFFAIDEKPTGSRDPFALRRAALGVIRIITENGLRLPLTKAFAVSEQSYRAASDLDGTFDPAALLAFFADRLKVQMRDKGVRHDLIEAVFSLAREDDLVRLLARVDALAHFLATQDGANLLTAYRRAANIVAIEEKKDGCPYDGPVDPALLEASEEKRLNDVLAMEEEALDLALEQEDFTAAMKVLARLRGPVDAFFDSVTVNCDKAPLRANRLRLLARIRAALNRVADFSRIEG